jgi:acyl-CoA thioesterase FadM
MYPAPRLAWQLWRHRNDPPLPLDGVHVSRHLCLPWDIDPWGELNNGRTLTLFDLARIPFARRVGLLAALRGRGWGLVVAGASVRYRRRIRAFDRIEMRSRALGWDARFVYVEQEMRVRGETASHALLSTAVTGKAGGPRPGIVPPAEVMRAMGIASAPPVLPDWVTAWATAEAKRPWPPGIGDAVGAA